MFRPLFVPVVDNGTDVCVVGEFCHIAVASGVGRRHTCHIDLYDFLLLVFEGHGFHRFQVGQLGDGLEIRLRLIFA